MGTRLDDQATVRWPSLSFLLAADGSLLRLVDQAVQPPQELHGGEVRGFHLAFRRDPGAVLGLRSAVRLLWAWEHGDGQGLLQEDGVIGVHPVRSLDLFHLRKTVCLVKQGWKYTQRPLNWGLEKQEKKQILVKVKDVWV